MGLRCSSSIRIVLGLFVLGGLASCASMKESPKNTTGKSAPLKNLVELQSSSPAKPKAHTDKRATLPEELTLTQSALKVTAPKEKGPRFTLAARDADVSTVLLAMGKEIDQNIVIDPGITDRVTVDLKEVTLVEALKSILEPLKLNYKMERDFIRVSRSKMETRIFRLNYIISRRRGTSNLQTSSGGSGGGQATSGSGSLSSTGTSSGATGRSTSSIVTNEETDLWTEILTGLQQISTGGVSGGGGTATSLTSGVTGTSGVGTSSTGTASTASAPGSGATASTSGQPATSSAGRSGVENQDRPYFTLNRQSGVIVVRDYPSVLLQVANFLEAVEGSAQRQVFIEAKILEVTLSDGYELGIDWSRVSPFNVLTAGSAGVGGGLLGSLGQAVIAGDGILRGSTRGGVSYSVPTGAMDIVIDALAQQGDVSVLSSPKIATLNNQRAVIKVGREDIFFTSDISRGTGGQGDLVTFTPESITIGIVLDVLPQINDNGDIMMSINTSITEEVARRETPGGSSGLSVPVLDVRESNSVVMAQNGQTIIIGGLMKTKKEKKNNSVPIMGDIPILGALFQHEEETESKVELIIMLVPEVMVGQAANSRLVSAHDNLINMNSGTLDFSGLPELTGIQK